MKKNLYTIAFSLLVLNMSNPVMAQTEMLYVGKADNTLDIALTDYFALEGYNVTFVVEDEFKAEGGLYSTADGYDGMDVLFVSESIGSSSANNYMNAGFPIPCIATEGYVVRSNRWGILADDSETYFNQASSANLTEDVLTMVITDTEHWITQEFEAEHQLVWADAADPTELGVTAFNLNEDIDGAIPLAEFLFDMGGLPSVWAIPEGSLLHETTELPNMVFIGIIQTDVEEGHTFTGEFLDFLVRCVRWVTDDYEPVGIHKLPQEAIVAGPNPTTGLVYVSFSIPEAGNVRANIYDMAGKLMESSIQDYFVAGHNTMQLDFSDLPGGPYVYEIITRNDVFQGWVIKE